MKTAKSKTVKTAKPRSAKAAEPKAKSKRAGAPHAADEKILAKHANGFPETTEDFPWGHRAVKVKGKAFVFMSTEEGTLSLSVKLPKSGHFALMQEFASPTGYGLGKSGWVTASFEPKEKVPLDLMKDWLAESYRAVAPKKIAALLG